MTYRMTSGPEEGMMGEGIGGGGRKEPLRRRRGTELPCTLRESSNLEMRRLFWA